MSSEAAQLTTDLTAVAYHKTGRYRYDLDLYFVPRQGLSTSRSTFGTHDPSSLLCNVVFSTFIAKFEQMRVDWPHAGPR